MTTTIQPSLFSPPPTIIQPDYARNATIQQRFEQFHRENPHVLAYLARLCLDARRRGRKRWSINGAFEVARYSSLMTTGDEYRLNNDYRSRYARLLAETYPELDGFFETRELKAA